MKICFIIPEGESTLATHAAYLPLFIQEVAKRRTVTTINESAQFFRFQPLTFLETFLRALRARTRGFKTFYIHYSYSGALAAKLVTLLLGGRVFYWNCGMMWLFGEKRFLRFLLKHTVTFLVTGNETMKRGYHEHLGVPLEKIKVMPNWVDIERFSGNENRASALRTELGIPFDAPVMLFLHRLAPRKGSRYLPDIIAGVATHVPATHCVIAGSGPDEEWLKQTLAKQKNVHFLGAWPNSQVPELMAASDAYIMPSEEEGFPRVIIEAQAAGLPYAAFDVGGTREISPKETHEYIIPGKNLQKLIKALQHLLTLPAKERGALKYALQKHVLRYDTRTIAEHFASMIHPI